jgi:predicted DNA-binding transcriptional regulator YafY
MQQYIGKLVQLIYVDSKQQVSIRNVRILAVGEQRLLAYCDQAKGVRTFTRAGIVDVEVIQWKAS